MDSPEGNRIVPTSSASPPVQESPFSNFIRTLSPINSVKSIVQGFSELNFPSPPPVFTSPRINTQQRESFLKRPQFSHPSNAELSLQNDSYKMVGGASDVSSSSQKECDSKSSVQVQSCSPSECVDEFLADPVDPEDSVNSIHSASLCLEQTNGAPKALESTSSLKENREKVCDKVDNRKGTDTEAMTEPITLLEQAEEEVSVKLLFPNDPIESEAEQQKDCEMLPGEHKRVNSEKNGALAESDLFIQHDSVARNDKNLVVQNSKDLSSIITMEEEHQDADFDKRQRPNCSTNLRSHRSEDVTMQNADGGQQDELDCTPQLLPESLQIPQAFQDLNEKSGLLPNESLESRMQCDFEESSQHQRGMLRRCLQFEAAGGQGNVSGNVGQNTANMTPRTSDLGDLDLCDLGPSVASSPKQPLDLSQPAPSKLSHSPVQSSDTRVDKSIRDCGNAAVTAPVPTGIGLHLNSIVHSSARVSGVTRSMKSVEKRHVNVQRQKSFCGTNIHFQDDSGGSSLPLKIIGENSSLVDDNQQESQAIVLTTSDSSQLPDNMNALKTPQQLQLIECHSIPTRKRKSASESADIVEEFNHPSPKKGRRKASSNAQNEGCKRCNCKRSKCLKLYCECFAAGVYCADPCACQECFNKPEYEDTVLGVRQQIESRNPLAFAPKIVQRVSESSANSGEESNRTTPSSARHKRGCNCKKSLCLKKYCECYQSGVGCSEACRCEGCKNVYGLKEEFIYRRAVDERWEDLSNEKLDMVEVRRDHSHREHSHPESLSPLTPSFDCSNHGKNVSKPRVPARRRLPSPESDSSALSSYGKSAGSPNNNNGKQQKMSEEILDIVPYDQDLDCTNVGRVDQFTPRWDGLTQNCNLTPSLHPSRATVSFFSSSSSDHVKISRASSSCGSVHLSSVSSLRWHSSPITPMPPLGGNHFTPEMDSDNGLYDVLGDETPEILKDTATPVNVVKASSPNKKRVSPPHSRLHELRSNSSTSLRSGRKFILQAVPSFPPLSPDCDPKGSDGNK